MNKQPSHNLDGLEIDVARQIDAICRRFEADWRQGRGAPVDDYLGGVPEGAQAALRTELEALLRELRPSEGTEPTRPPIWDDRSRQSPRH